MDTQSDNITSNNMVQRMLQGITVGNSGMSALPGEVINQIMDSTSDEHQSVVQRTSQWPGGVRPLAYTPPATGVSPFMRLPTELRREIFGESLPARDTAHSPKCDDDDADYFKHHEERADPKKPKKAKRGPTTNLMVLNKKICGEIAEVIYEERCFVIHVHEGLRYGGIEFLHSGRQPLQYQDCIDDQRFWKFKKGTYAAHGVWPFSEFRTQLPPPLNPTSA